MASLPLLPTYFVSHGGGPWPWMTGQFRRNFDKLEQSLRDMREEVGGIPRAILVVSGHWEAHGFHVSSGIHPGMIYDYYGFPEHLYRITYGAPGSPELAHRVNDLIARTGMKATLDPNRGFDHGTFSIMKPLYPDENIPVVQLSLDARLDPAMHVAVGRALAPLRQEGILIVGSGLSYHNLSAMRGNRGQEVSRHFDVWLQETLINNLAQERISRLVEWESAPGARSAHPREDHLLPLMVVVGAAEFETGAVTYHQTDFAGSLTVSSFRFGLPPDVKSPNTPNLTK